MAIFFKGGSGGGSSDPTVGITLTASPSGFTPTSYQWNLNGSPIGGETTANLAVSELASVLSGDTYSCTVAYTAAGTVTTRYYTASDTWTKPAGLVEVLVGAVGAGGSGGSGRRGAAASNRAGGGGGQGACIAWRRVSVADLGTTESVTIAAATTGGAAISANDTSGANGANGGNTSFGAHVIAKGGSGGGGGTAASGSAGSANAVGSGCTPAYGPFAYSGGEGGGSTPTVSGAGRTAMNTADTSQITVGCAGGGGGGGLNTSDTERAGGAGGGIYDVGSLTAGGVGGFVNASGGSRDGTPGNANAANNFMFLTSAALTHAPSAGPGGGASESDGVTAAGNGASANNYGAGGGGGGASANGANSGAGGNGAQGLVVVIEYGV